MASVPGLESPSPQRAATPSARPSPSPRSRHRPHPPETAPPGRPPRCRKTSPSPRSSPRSPPPRGRRSRASRRRRWSADRPGRRPSTRPGRWRLPPSRLTASANGPNSSRTACPCRPLDRTREPDNRTGGSACQPIPPNCYRVAARCIRKTHRTTGRLLPTSVRPIIMVAASTGNHDVTYLIPHGVRTAGRHNERPGYKCACR